MAHTELDALAARFWDSYLAHHPTEAHLLGVYDHAAAYEDSSRAAEDAWIDELDDVVAAVRAIDPTTVDGEDEITLLVLESNAVLEAERERARMAELGVDPIFGPQVDLPIVTGMLSLPDVAVSEALVSKFAAAADNFGQQIERLREGVEAGRVPPAFAVRDTVAQLDEQLAVPLDEDPILAAVPAPADGVDEGAWRAALREVVASRVRPALAAYRDMLRDELLPVARPDEQCGLSWLADGEATYAALLRYSTTTSLTAQEIHDIGLEQVAKLAEEYRALGPEVVGSNDLATIFEAMRSDPKLHFERGEQMVEESEVAMARAWAAMPDWFEVLPQAPCEVRATESGAKAFYFPPAADGSRGGTFFINVDDPASWGTFELESMAFHEGIPGHHLQLTIASELTGVPEFRKHLHNTAYAEGWGLYTERLADEMGLYSGAVGRIGMYAADSMRACRLVVDTGIHALGWTRQQAVDYMVDNSPLTPEMVRPEIDRYIANPGQATSYMIGRLEILRIRAEAQARQGEAFDIKLFHNAVLNHGSLPLGALDEVVRAELA